MSETRESNRSTGQILYRVDEVVPRLGLSKSTVWQLIATGRLESVRVGRARRVTAEALDRFVESLRAEAMSTNTQ